jgi:hypothetical protein
MAPGDTMSLWRRIPPSLGWGTTPYQSGLTVTTYTDFNVNVGQTYEYKVTFNGSSHHTPAFIKAAVARPATALENRGTIIVLVDADLLSQYSATMNAVLAQVNTDLVSDGWTVV